MSDTADTTADLPDFARLVDLAAARVGGRALHATDEFFAEKENLLLPGRSVFIADKYTDRGKWMDGWESRRRRGPGHDTCVIALGLAGIVRGVEIDTNFFTGNHPEHASLEACEAPRTATTEELGAPQTRWVELIPISKLLGGSRNFFAVPALPSSDGRGQRFTHVRLHIYPDGGVARLRVHGDVVPEWTASAGGLVDLAAIENGGLVELANDMYFGRKDNLIMPGPSVNMGDGWETRRKRGPGHDWVIVRLGARGKIGRIEVDTSHFKGNYPDRCSIEGLDLGRVAPEEFLGSRSLPWVEIVAPAKLEADRLHVYEKELRAQGPFTHVRLNIFPDGGVARLRVYGTRVG